MSVYFKRHYICLNTHPPCINDSEFQYLWCVFPLNGRIVSFRTHDDYQTFSRGPPQPFVGPSLGPSGSVETRESFCSSASYLGSRTLCTLLEETWRSGPHFLQCGQIGGHPQLWTVCTLTDPSTGRTQTPEGNWSVVVIVGVATVVDGGSSMVRTIHRTEVPV